MTASNPERVKRMKGEPINVARVDEVSLAMQGELFGLPSTEQLVILGDLLAIWLAGHPASKHERLLMTYIRGVRELVPVYAARINDPEN
jgi:hypothetical protein